MLAKRLVRSAAYFGLYFRPSITAFGLLSTLRSRGGVIGIGLWPNFYLGGACNISLASERYIKVGLKSHVVDRVDISSDF